MTLELYKRDIDIEWDGRFYARDWEMVANWETWSVVIFGVAFSWTRYFDRPMNVRTIRTNVTLTGGNHRGNH